MQLAWLKNTQLQAVKQRRHTTWAMCEYEANIEMDLEE
jgi:hypothetical protein